MSNFSRDKTIVAFCGPSFIIRSKWALYFRVCSMSGLVLCVMNVNESVISITSPGSRHGKLATEQLRVFVQNFKPYYMSTCLHVKIFFTDMS